MNFKSILCFVLLITSMNIIAQNKTTKTTTKTDKVTRIVPTISKLKIKPETDAKNNVSLNAKLEENKKKSKAAKAKRDQISKAVRRRLAVNKNKETKNNS